MITHISVRLGIRFSYGELEMLFPDSDAPQEDFENLESRYGPLSAYANQDDGCLLVSRRSGGALFDGIPCDHQYSVALADLISPEKTQQYKQDFSEFLADFDVLESRVEWHIIGYAG